MNDDASPSPVIPLPTENMTEWINEHIHRIGGVDSPSDERYKTLINSLVADSPKLDRFVLGSFVMTSSGTQEIRDAFMRGFGGKMGLSSEVKNSGKCNS